MTPFLEASLENVNFPYTAVMGLIVLYWITVAIGLLDISSFDFDVDADVDVDVDVDVDADMDADADSGGGSSFGKLLNFFNIGYVPFMIIFSVLASFMWFISVLANHYLDNQSGWIALGMSPVILFVSLFLTKFATIPLVKVFQKISVEYDLEVIGKIGTLTESADGHRISQAKVIGSDGIVQLLDVKTSEGTTIPRGEKVLIVSFEEENKYYHIEPFGNLSDS